MPKMIRFSQIPLMRANETNFFLSPIEHAAANEGYGDFFVRFVHF